MLFSHGIWMDFSSSFCSSHMAFDALLTWHLDGLFIILLLSFSLHVHMVPTLMVFSSSFLLWRLLGHRLTLALFWLLFHCNASTGHCFTSTPQQAIISAMPNGHRFTAIAMPIWTLWIITVHHFILKQVGLFFIVFCDDTWSSEFRN